MIGEWMWKRLLFESHSLMTNCRRYPDDQQLNDELQWADRLADREAGEVADCCIDEAACMQTTNERR